MSKQQGRFTSFVVGAAIGALSGWVINYLWGPSNDADITVAYQSRWDYALSEGRTAAAEREAELRRQFAEVKQSNHA
ncbi:MAG: hypothetical protein R3C14_17825 [Caldilineaceae bacterium]